MHASALILTCLLLLECPETTGAEESGCLLWRTSGQTDVCCEKCKPGNRLVDDCGTDPRKLCKLCEQGMFSTEPRADTCTLCKTCNAARQLEKQKCNASHDTVCGCEAGFQCADAQCSHCVTECGIGKQPSAPDKCLDCPPGTFNDKIHSRCHPWSVCLPGQRVLVNGTASSDRVCDVVNPSPSRREECTPGFDSMMVVFASIAFFLLGLLPSLILASIMYRRAVVEKKHAVHFRKPTAQVMCHLGQPEQEQGSISGSLSSEDSEKSLLSV